MGRWQIWAVTGCLFPITQPVHLSNSLSCKIHPCMPTLSECMYKFMQQSMFTFWKSLMQNRNTVHMFINLMLKF